MNKKVVAQVLRLMPNYCHLVEMMKKAGTFCATYTSNPKEITVPKVNCKTKKDHWDVIPPVNENMDANDGDAVQTSVRRSKCFILKHQS